MSSQDYADSVNEKIRAKSLEVKDSPQLDNFSEIFLDDYIYSHPEAIVPDLKSFEYFTNDVVNLISPETKVLSFFVGPSRSGKSTIFRQFYSNIENSAAASSNLELGMGSVLLYDYNDLPYTFKNIGMDYKTLFPSSDKPPSILDYFSEWSVNADFSEAKIILLDHLPEHFLNFLAGGSFDLFDLLLKNKKSDDYPAIILICISNLELAKFNQSTPLSQMRFFGQYPKFFSVQLPSPHDIKRIIFQRIKIGFPDIENPLSDDLLSIVGEISLGLPGLALLICREFFRYNKWNVLIEEKSNLSEDELIEKNKEILYRFLDKVKTTGWFSAINLIKTTLTSSKVTPELLKILDMSDSFFSSKITSSTNITTGILSTFLLEKENTLLRKTLIKPYSLLRIEMLKIIALCSIDAFDDRVSRSDLKPLFLKEDDASGSIQESKLTYHIQKLSSEKAVSLMKFEKEVKLSLNPPMREAIELACFPLEKI